MPELSRRASRDEVELDQLDSVLLAVHETVLDLTKGEVGLGDDPLGPVLLCERASAQHPLPSGLGIYFELDTPDGVFGFCQRGGVVQAVREVVGARSPLPGARTVGGRVAEE